jgi:hypothetical protein
MCNSFWICFITTILYSISFIVNKVTNMYNLLHLYHFECDNLDFYDFRLEHIANLYFF